KNRRTCAYIMQKKIQCTISMKICKIKSDFNAIFRKPRYTVEPAYKDSAYNDTPLITTLFRAPTECRYKRVLLYISIKIRFFMKSTVFQCSFAKLPAQLPNIFLRCLHLT